MNKQLLLESISKNEGLRLNPYKCPADKLTIGYGSNLADKGITQSEALFLLNNDVIQINSELEKDFPFYKKMDEIRQNVIVEMVFILGLTGFKKFKSMIGYLEKLDYENASIEMLDSKFHRDFINYAPNEPVENLRSSKLAKQLKEGKYV